MNQVFWARMHGGATHFPIALIMVSVVFDVAGFFCRNEVRSREFRSVGFYSLLIAAAASPAAVLSGIALSKGVLLGTGMLALHHYFIWPAFGLLIGLAVWRSNICLEDYASIKDWKNALLARSEFLVPKF